MAADPRDRPQHARLVARPASRSRVQRANDHALEWLILSARALSVLLILLFLVAGFAGIWWPVKGWWMTGSLALLWGGFTGWWGWWLNGNEDWRRRG